MLHTVDQPPPLFPDLAGLVWMNLIENKNKKKTYFIAFHIMALNF